MILEAREQARVHASAAATRMLQKRRSLDVPQFNTIEEALDASLEIMRARFPDPDQQAIVLLAEALYTCQERERFEQRGSRDHNVAYGR